ncbi:MAG: response regulator transcription factor [Candidatus Eremiobacteraeota bacterium]|nr:response regulator transcription factor [Candidatus Eremiobacteraeota bacterium]
MIGIGIVDDHPIVRAGIQSVLETQNDFHVVAAVASADALAPETRPDAIVLDWELQGAGGAAAIGALRERFISAKITIFSAYAGEERVRAALEAGAKGYVLKGSPGSELITAVRSIFAGGTYLGSGISSPSTGGIDRLTKRELEVLQLASTGRSNDEIAATLAVSTRTVKFHMSSIFGRLGASRRSQAIAIAKERGLF